MRVGVLGRIDLNGAVVIGEGPGPVIAHTAGLWTTQKLPRPAVFPEIKEPDTRVGEVGIRRHERPLLIRDGMPGVEIRDAAGFAVIRIHADDPVGPVHQGQFPPPRNPGFMGDPLRRPGVPGKDAPALPCAEVQRPHAVRQRPGESAQQFIFERL